MVNVPRAILCFDGASRDNPNGPAGCGYVVYEMDDKGKAERVILEGRKYLGYNCSCNEAEYHGLLEGLTAIDDDMYVQRLYIRGDSMLIIQQINGDYQVSSPKLELLHDKVKAILEKPGFPWWRAKHIGRHFNQAADKLANDAIIYKDSKKEYK